MIEITMDDENGGRKKIVLKSWNDGGEAYCRYLLHTHRDLSKKHVIVKEVEGEDD